ncbi:MAG: helix-turn-helix domain-containing protein [Paracoccus sp. (in: a-proteobacteria)]|uniref:helix-turn-helix transcriptional regulator n=1 Tax=Paracoccus sp. TaxID=267 RepID=UPI0026DFEF1C|nr:helix-turn-helix domain-containing protein [Paracoccus sp. (in: a-proteobacteria)]MDO5612926.1 helix-turn-helix domain-containing protein [Paracoccus sp. (in: a-proteobacteria)]
MEATELLTVRQAAERLKLSATTLNRWRVTGEGPAFVKLGRAVRYTSAALAAFVDGKHHTSTMPYTEGRGDA